MLNKLSIQAKLLSALAIIIIISVISGGFVVRSVMQANQAVKDVEHISEVSTYIADLEEQATETHQHMTSFVSTGNLEEKELYEKKLQNIKPLFANFPNQTNDTVLLEILGEYEQKFLEWNETIAKKQIYYMQSPETVDMARLLESSTRNMKLWEDIINHYHALSAELTRQTSDRSHDLNVIMAKASWASITGLVLTILTTLAASIFIIFMVSKPLQKLVISTQALVKKKWDTQIDGVKRNDEIGQMANALVLFRDNGMENEKLMAAQKMEDEQRLTRAKAIEKMVDDFREQSSLVTVALEDATHKMSSSSVTMGEIANDTSKLSSEVAQSAQSAGSNVNNVSAATEELTASIQEISQQLTKTSKMAQDAKGVSEHTVDKMKILEASANEISSVVEIISDIAEQTNLLALNATIEAARAGDAGKGFAVVANEVKTLASETASATDKVIEQINRIQGDTKEAVSFIEKISGSIEDLNLSMTTIAAAMEEQTAATQEISRNVSEASAGTSTVVRSIDDVTASTIKTQETSRGVSEIADELKERSVVLTQSINKFITDIQSA